MRADVAELGSRAGLGSRHRRRSQDWAAGTGDDLAVAAVCVEQRQRGGKQPPCRSHTQHNRNPTWSMNPRMMRWKGQSLYPVGCMFRLQHSGRQPLRCAQRELSTGRDSEQQRCTVVARATPSQLLLSCTQAA